MQNNTEQHSISIGGSFTANPDNSFALINKDSNAELRQLIQELGARSDSRIKEEDNVNMRILWLEMYRNYINNGKTSKFASNEANRAVEEYKLQFVVNR